MDNLVYRRRSLPNLTGPIFRTFLLFFSWLALTGGVSAQYTVDNWNTDNGLPQNTVRTILQTRDGYLWFGTQDGLVRFDGVKFVTFNTANTKGLGSNRFICLFEDSIGRLWAGTDDGGVIKYQNGAFRTYGIKDGLPSDSIHAIRDRGQGHILVVTSKGLAHDEVDRFVSDNPLSDRSPDSFVYLGPSGTIWYFDNNNIRKIKNGNISNFPFPTPGRGESVTMLFEDNHDTLWLSEFGGKLISYKNGALTAYTKNEGLPDVYATAMFEDRQGILWAGFHDGSLGYFQNGRFISVVPAVGPQDQSVISIYQDQESTIWFGTANRGINRLNKTAITTYTVQNGLKINIVYPIYQDPVGNIWVGEDGLSKFTNGTFVNYGRKQELHYYGVMSLFADRDGKLWVGSVGGLGYFKDNQFTPLNTLLGFTPNTYTVWAILEDHNGTFWFGTDRGLAKYAGDRVTIYTTKDGLPGDDVKAIHEDKKGNLWFGTYGGLARLDVDRFVSYTENEGLAGNRVRSIYEDSDGVFWIGTYDGGLGRLKDGKFTRYRTEDGLYNNGAFEILEDDQKNFWISCNRGIYRVKKQELNDFADGKIKSIASVSFGRQDGLLNIECNGGRQPSGLKTPDGKLWFPTQGGIAVIDPRSVPFNSKPPSVLIESGTLEREHLTLDGEIRIPPGKGNLEVTYTALSLIKSEQIRFKYRLAGVDPDWTDVGTRRTVYFSHLPPGQYTLEIIAANSDGVWSPQGARIVITVIPSFWQTWWFAVSVTIAVIAVALLIYRRRVSQLQRAHAVQAAFSRQLMESQESERKRIAAELHDSLGQNLLIIKNWTLLAMNKVDGDKELKEQLNEISDTASQSIEEVRVIAHDLRPYQLDDIGLTRVLRAMINRVAASSEIKFTSEIDDVDNLLAPDSQIGFYRIVQEALNNIVKHSKATAANIKIKREQRTLLLVIEDNGRGFSREKTTEANSGRQGFGLTGIAERTRILGGTLNMQSEPGRGTRIVVTIALQDSTE